MTLVSFLVGVDCRSQCDVVKDPKILNENRETVSLEIHCILVISRSCGSREGPKKPYRWVYTYFDQPFMTYKDADANAYGIVDDNAPETLLRALFYGADT